MNENQDQEISEWKVENIEKDRVQISGIRC